MLFKSKQHFSVLKLDIKQPLKNKHHLIGGNQIKNVYTYVNKEETWDLRCLSIPSDKLKWLNAFLFPRTSLGVVLVLGCYRITQNNGTNCRLTLGKTSHKEGGKCPTCIRTGKAPSWSTCPQCCVEMPVTKRRSSADLQLLSWSLASMMDQDFSTFPARAGRFPWQVSLMTMQSNRDQYFEDMQLAHHSCGKDQKDAMLFSGRGL